jgi:RNA polymerase sigma-70 factor (ECF subfamily)
VSQAALPVHRGDVARAAPHLRVVGVPSSGGAETSRAGDGVDDAELVRRARSGDRWAEEMLYRRHAGRVLNAATRMLGRHADADDVMQDAFVTALGKLDRLEDPAKFGAWVVRIAVNGVRMRLRRRKLRRMLGLERGLDATLGQLADVGARADLRAELAEVDAVLQRLPTDERLVWLLHRVEGLSLRETAEAVGVSTATVKRKLSAADGAIEVRRSGRGWKA